MMRFRVIYRATCVCLSACATLECVPCARVYDGCTSCDGPRVCRAAVGSTRYQIELSQKTQNEIFYSYSELRRSAACGAAAAGRLPRSPAPRCALGLCPRTLVFCSPSFPPRGFNCRFPTPMEITGLYTSRLNLRVRVRRPADSALSVIASRYATQNSTTRAAPLPAAALPVLGSRSSNDRD